MDNFRPKSRLVQLISFVYVADLYYDDGVGANTVSIDLGLNEVIRRIG
jgi:hypothetical protein